jgi:hypothetical protein
MANMSGPEEIGEGKEKKDLFHHGVISKLFPSNNMGLVRTKSGKEVPFSFQLVLLMGEIANPVDLKEGLEVGYDLGWTANGLRVTKIKTYPRHAFPEGGANLEGEGGKKENLPS